jgi:uracil phosphoribosyltransferase
MRIHHIAKNNSILNTFLYELRSTSIQKDRMRFRRNIERIGELLSYELSKSLSYAPQITRTPLGSKIIELHDNNVVICSILRAGLPLHTGVLNYFDNAENAFISAYRKLKKNGRDFEIKVEYLACPDLTGKTLILVDPMLATGQSLALTYDALLANGKPKDLHLMSVIGALEGIDFIKHKFPKHTHLWIGDIDSTLDAKGYIIPGLGDAGDLAYGIKRQH